MGCITWFILVSIALNVLFLAYVHCVFKQYETLGVKEFNLVFEFDETLKKQFKDAHEDKKTVYVIIGLIGCFVIYCRCLFGIYKLIRWVVFGMISGIEKLVNSLIIGKGV